MWWTWFGREMWQRSTADWKNIWRVIRILKDLGHFFGKNNILHVISLFTMCDGHTYYHLAVRSECATIYVYIIQV